MFIKRVVFCLFLIFCCDGAFAVTARGGNVQQNQAVRQTNVNARAAVARRNASVPPKAISARVATNKTSAVSAKNVSARAGATQKIINSGTTVVAATENTVAADCQNLYASCMDNFCMIDNVDGGRCVCSDKYRTLTTIVQEIDEINKKSYKMSTLGVEKIESVVTGNPGLDTNVSGQIKLSGVMDAVLTTEHGSVLRNSAHNTCVEKLPQCADKITIVSGMYSGRVNSDCAAYENSLKKLLSDAKSKLNQAETDLTKIALNTVQDSNKYDLGQCTIKFRECMQTTAGCGDDFSGCVDTTAINRTPQTDKNGKEIISSVTIPGTTSGMTISKSFYDALTAKAPICKTVTQQCVKVADQVFDSFLAESADDLFVAEMLAENNVRNQCVKNISDCFHNACRDNIDPADPDGSYDACLMRPEMMLSFCKLQLESCGVNATDAQLAKQSQVWDFVLARLAGMKVDACTTDLKKCLTDENRCGPDYSGCVGLSTDAIIRLCPYDKLMGCQTVYDKELSSNAVYERLSETVQGIILNIDNNLLAKCQAAVDVAAQRVCGPDLDCGGMINLDTIGLSQLDYKICQWGIQGEDMVFLDHCYINPMDIPDVDLGRVHNSASGELGPVVSYAAKVDGIIYWEYFTVDNRGKLQGVDDYLDMVRDKQGKIPEYQEENLKSAIFGFRNSIDNIIKSIESDPTVNACMVGRSIDGSLSGRVARFPNLTDNIRIQITNKLLQRAKKNYYAKYDELMERTTQDYIKMSERMAEIKGENFKDKHREIARQSCVAMAEISAMAKSPEPPSNTAGIVIAAILIAIATVVACVFTFGGAAAAIGAVAATTASLAGTGASVSLGTLAAGTTISAMAGVTSVAVGGAVGTATVFGATAAAGAAAITGIVAGAAGGALAAATIVTGAVQGAEAAKYNTQTFDANNMTELTGEYELVEYNYKEKVNTVFNPDDLTCEKTVKVTRCKVTKEPIFGDYYCKEWGEPTTTTKTIQF